MMPDSKRLRPAQAGMRIAAAAAFLALLGACAPEVNIRGNAVDKTTLALIKPGQQTRQQVIELLGSPTSVATFDKNTIYYITQKTEMVAFHEPKILSRTVVAIHFNKDNRVASIKTLDLKNGEKIDPVDRTTPTPGRQFTIVQQLIGNIGRFEGNNSNFDTGADTVPDANPQGY